MMKECYKDYSFSVGYMSMTSNQYQMMIDLLESYKPNHIIEFGCGVSTTIFENYCKRNNSTLLSIEHNPLYLRKDSVLCELIENATLQINSVSYGPCNYYNGLENILKKITSKFDFILIDGPLGYGFREKYEYGRVQLLSFVLLDKIADSSVILIHDSQRKNMQKTINLFKHMCQTKNFSIIREEEIVDNNNPAALYIVYLQKNDSN